jgi:hypothetical protein
MFFSKESILLIKNWDTLEDIQRSYTNLESELSNLLQSIKYELEKRTWWNSNWIYQIYKPDQNYITRKEWQIGTFDFLWIGIESYGVKNVFGEESVPRMYVWINNDKGGFAKKIVEEIQRDKKKVLGELDIRAGNGYIAHTAAQKCLPDQLESYPDTFKQQMLDFYDFWVKRLEPFELIIQEYLKKQKKENKK